MCQNSNLLSQDLNSVKAQSLPTEMARLVSGLDEAQVFNVSAQKKFSERQSDR